VGEIVVVVVLLQHEGPDSVRNEKKILEEEAI